MSQNLLLVLRHCNGSLRESQAISTPRVGMHSTYIGAYTENALPTYSCHLCYVAGG